MPIESDHAALVERVVAAASQPCRVSLVEDGVQVELGSETEDWMDGAVVVIRWGGGMEIRLPTLNWPKPYDPVRSSTRWREVSDPGSLDSAALSELFQKACRARRRQYKRCRFCSEIVPPENRFAPDVCHACASDQFNVVY